MYKNALKEDLIRVVEDLDGTVESTDTIAKLKTKIEKSSTFESDADFVKTLIKNCIDERVSRNEREATLEKQKIELAKLQRTLNSTISRSTQMTPFQLLTGVKMRTKQDLEILKLLEQEIVETFTENREKIREEAKRNILKMQEENCRNFNKKRKKAYQYEIGDIVAIQRTQFRTGLKLRPKFFGPYEVVKSLSVPSFLYVSDSPLVSMKKKRNKYRCGQRTVWLAVVESVVESSSN
ncbi:blastopia polyprotein [Trichonephila clavipes]|uniref:Blastopia polyprotein n=1 Tax=Trichonephila clavipes TaxID=2585209 RepID=A0A8X6RV15_TRICX|nr:blastopia polyprotein [Trichonephila clavipes]